MHIFATRQCADHARTLYSVCRCRWGTHGMCCICCRKLFGVHSIQAAMAPSCRRLWPPSPLPKNAIVCNQLWVKHI